MTNQDDCPPFSKVLLEKALRRRRTLSESGIKRIFTAHGKESIFCSTKTHQRVLKDATLHILVCPATYLVILQKEKSTGTSSTREELSIRPKLSKKSQDLSRTIFMMIEKSRAKYNAFLSLGLSTEKHLAILPDGRIPINSRLWFPPL